MSDTHIESSITEKARQVRPPSGPVKQLERISIEAYREATRPVTQQKSIALKYDLSKLNPSK